MITTSLRIPAVQRCSWKPFTTPPRSTYSSHRELVQDGSREEGYCTVKRRSSINTGWRWRRRKHVESLQPCQPSWQTSSSHAHAVGLQYLPLPLEWKIP